MSVSEFSSISKQNPAFPEYLNFETLRSIGIAHLQQMSGKLWTDYNLHDPGVTILEVLCYAVTELGYRNNLDLKDLLAKAPTSEKQEEDNFFTPDQILTCNPVTELDLRKCLLDIKGVRNAWIQRCENYHLVGSKSQGQWTVRLESPPKETEAKQPETSPEGTAQQDAQSGPWLRGLYTVLLDLDPPTYFDACGQPYQPLRSILNEVRSVLNSYRNLCEDFHELVVLGEEDIVLRGEIELESGADANDVLVQIFIQVQNFLAPSVQFHSLQTLLDRGKDPAEIFAGRPSAIAHHDAFTPNRTTQNHGFIDTDELEALTLPSQLYTSDLYRIMLDVPGVVAVKRLTIQSHISGLAQSPEQVWSLTLAANFRPVLGLDQSNLVLMKGGLPIPIDREKVKRHYFQQKLASLKAYQNEADLDLAIPQGNYSPQLAEHYSIQHDFPLTYGISEDGLPQTASSLRQSQANQLKAYLVFFDQILANYLAQLSRVRELFSWNPASARTYFTQVLDFPGIEKILNPSTDAENPVLPHQWEQRTNDEFLSFLKEIEEPDATLEQRERRNRFLDHLLARFAESFTDYVLLNYRINPGISNTDLTARLIQDKTSFLQEYPQLSRDRFRAANVSCQNTPNRRYVSGFEQRIARLLGIRTGSTERSLVRYSVAYQPGHFRIHMEWKGTSRDGDRPLIVQLRVRQICDTLEAAQTARDGLLASLRNPAHFQRLIYRHAYYGWEVVDNDGTSLALYHHSYPTDIARNAALTPLVQQLRRAMFAQFTDLLSADLPLQRSLDETLTTLLMFHWKWYLKIQSHFPLQDVAIDLWFISLIYCFISRQALSMYLVSLQSGLLNHLDATPQNTLLVSHFLEPGNSTVLKIEPLPPLDAELLAKLRIGVIRSLLGDIIELNGSGQEIGFVLKLPSTTTHPQLDFVSIQRYRHPDAAQDAAIKTLVQLLFKTSYQPINITPRDVLEGAIDGKVDTYGFAIVDAQGKIQADMDSALGLETPEEREAILQWLQSLETTTEQNAELNNAELNIVIQQVAPGFIGGLSQGDGKMIPLLETQRFTEELAGLFCRDYPGQTTDPSEAITWLTDETLLSSIGRYLEGKRPIALEIIQAEVANEAGHRTGGYRFCLKPSEDELSWQFKSLTLYPTARAARVWGERALARLQATQFPISETQPLRYLQRQIQTGNLPQVISGNVQKTLVIVDSERVSWAEDNAWRYGSALIRLVEIDDSVRLIDPQANSQTNPPTASQADSQMNPQVLPAPAPQREKTGGYAFALSGMDRRSTLARYPEDFDSAGERSQAIQQLRDSISGEGLYMVEHILLRPRQSDRHLSSQPDDHSLSRQPFPTLPITPLPGRMDDQQTAPAPTVFFDPYSFWITVVLPAWPRRFQDSGFRQFVENTLRTEAPAHVALKIVWVNLRSMRRFEAAYQTWMKRLSLMNCEDEDCGQAEVRTDLIQVLSDLRSVYPVATLDGPATPGLVQNPIILNQTPLGSMYE